MCLSIYMQTSQDRSKTKLISIFVAWSRENGETKIHSSDCQLRIESLLHSYNKRERKRTRRSCVHITSQRRDAFINVCRLICLTRKQQRRKKAQHHMQTERKLCFSETHNSYLTLEERERGEREKCHLSTNERKERK